MLRLLYFSFFCLLLFYVVHTLLLFFCLSYVVLFLTLSGFVVTFIKFMYFFFQDFVCVFQHCWNKCTIKSIQQNSPNAVKCKRGKDSNEIVFPLNCVNYLCSAFISNGMLFCTRFCVLVLRVILYRIHNRTKIIPKMWFILNLWDFPRNSIPFRWNKKKKQANSQPMELNSI